jgi:hypothetical protein
MYTIEFQKRGLPHAHILIFLHPSSKFPNPEDIDRIISAEIPDPHTETELYNLVKCHMIHGPCGEKRDSSPCMKSGKCSKFFPKKFEPFTIVDKDGFPVYRRRSDGKTVEKNKITLDNQFVVPYNKTLLLKYQAHINVEWCNQTTSIKYLFKYINKGYDRITATITETRPQNQEVDEIKQYLDCRYVSPCEACWRILGFPIHGRKPAVERLYFHLLGEHSVYFTDGARIDDVLLKPSVTESMFTAWLEVNKKFPEAKNLTYSNFISKFVYVRKKIEWKPRKRGFTIGRLIWVPPSTGELFYFRMLLTVVEGPTSYKEISTVNGIFYQSCRDACFARGFLGDDKEYIYAIQESKDWGSSVFLRKLFVCLLLANTMDRPRHVWDKTKHWLADGILYNQRKLAQNRGHLLLNTLIYTLLFSNHTCYLLLIYHVIFIAALELTEEEIDNLTLLEIEKYLQANRKSLENFPTMPFPKGYITETLGNRLIYDEKNYNVNEQHHEFTTLFASLTGITIIFNSYFQSYSLSY